MSRSPGFLYRLACGLSLAHIASGLTTIFVYDVEDATDSQFIAILYAIITSTWSMRIPHTTQKDNDPVSRLNKQFVIINFLLLCWVLSGANHTTISHCSTARFLSPKCLTVGLDMTLPFALIGTRAKCISWTIYRTAHAIQAAPAPPEAPRTPTPFKLRPTVPAATGRAALDGASSSV
ncbi:hypothetical protein B0H12DRAFT_1101949 [Mycena haematopus]|nr:hypothetical protein B0H12DRAFT_1101949 [Mycena haematopus]